jgi:hypothetical protein
MKEDTQKLFECYQSCINEGPSSAYVVINKKYTATVFKASDLESYLKSDKDQIDPKVFGKISQTHSNPKEMERIKAVIKKYGGSVNEAINDLNEDDLKIKGFDKEEKGKNTSTYFFADLKSIGAAKKQLEKDGFKKNDKDFYVKGKQKVEINIALTSKGGGTIKVFNETIDESADNDKTYKWSQINQAMMNIGYSPKIIFKLSSALNKIK